MEFVFETKYDLSACTCMAKALRKTSRTKRSRRSRIFGWIVITFGILLSLPRSGEPYIVDSNKVITWLAILTILATYIFEDRLNGIIAKKRMIPGLISSKTTFYSDNYVSQTSIGTTEFKYDTIVSIAEDRQYFIFIFSQNHAQVYDKSSLSGGTCSEFEDFITGVSNLSIAKI